MSFNWLQLSLMKQDQVCTLLIFFTALCTVM